MIQLQFLNKILIDKNVSLILEYGFDENYFSQYVEEYQFIMEHYNKYGIVPDDETMLAKFEGFDLIEVNEPVKYLVEALQEEHLYNQAVPVLNQAAALINEDSNEAVKYLLPNIQKLLQFASFNEGIDIMKNATKRYEWYTKLRDTTGLVGVTTGFEEQDTILGGWMKGEELVVIAGRPNEGKSWILGKYLVEAWKTGNKVLLYSGEMSEQMVSLRLDSMITNLSNKAMVSGTLDDNDAKRYEKELKDMERFETPFILVTSKELGNKPLTPTMLEGLIQKYKPDIVGIDQLSLMEDDNQKGSNKQKREIYFDITKKLFDQSAKYSIPILLDAQAKRGANNTEEGVPELEDLAESDGVGQNASRVLTLAQTEEGLKIGVRKNRYGAKDLIFCYAWTIDVGTFNYLPDYSTSKKGDKKDSKREQDLKFKNRRKIKQQKEEFGDGDGTDVF